MELVEETNSHQQLTIGSNVLVVLFWLATSLIFIWFIAQALYSSWVDTYSDNLQVTLQEVCSQNSGYSYWSQSDPEDPYQSPRPIFKCVLD